MVCLAPPLASALDICNYADDTTIYTCDSRLENVNSRLENDSKIIIDWFRNNYMKLNEDKCHFMIFGERTNQEVSINIGSCAVNNSKEEKLLGILIDANLSFEKHISNICQKAGNKLFALSRMSAYLGTDKLRLLMRAFVTSQFQYCPLVWMFHSRKMNNMNAKFNRFLANVNEIVKKHAPLKKLTKNDLKLRNKPWINNRIQKMMRLRDRLLKKIRKKPDATTKHLYKQFRNRVVIELKESKTKYFHDYFNVNSNNMKLLWTGIKSIISIKNSHVSVINKLKDTNGNLTTDSTAMANIFNKFFVNVADGVTKNIPRSPRSPLNYLKNKNPSSFFISPTAPYEISDIIDLLKTGK